MKTLEVAEAADLGYDMVLSNTFHLFLSPGPDLVRRFGGVHGFMRWDRPVITDSGGFQVFSMGHGTVADEIKGRNVASHPPGAGAILGIDEDGVRLLSYVDGSEKFMGPETSMAVQAALNPTSRSSSTSASRSTSRASTRALAPSARTAGSTAASPGTRSTGRWQGSTRSSRAGWRRTSAAGARGGQRPRHVRARHRRHPRAGQAADVRGRRLDDRGAPGGARPHLLGIGDVDDLLRGAEPGIDTFDCAMPTRIGRHGMAIVRPERRWRADLAKGRFRESDEPICEGCPCAACAAG